MDSSHMSISMDGKSTSWIYIEAKTMDTIEYDRADRGTLCHKRLPWLGMASIPPRKMAMTADITGNLEAEAARDCLREKVGL
jgi:hypothetical protein